ncbi:hypothetical protein A3D11_02760 [Candidatus Peribacteria bacterium RIFCSPHIGHO2_02_FULL_49_16]|nr:MAG: hypothetical protein A2880_01800 [Candidatus Peribacteria bacterium RIFCSPHIGHO2_01_FULL_49_38]OGJ58514.1 MAG: hypothetical protein A3D11_02760 [Candidatus Peribacteria bacterium RIFCSPHIGHO2_02_FULL_49_16]
MITISHPLIAQHFAFSYGRLGVLQRYLLDETDKDRLLGSRTIEEAEHILMELSCTGVIDQGLSHFEDILSALEQWVQHEVQIAALQQKKHIFDIVWLEGDKVLLSFLYKQERGWVKDTGRKLLSGISVFSEEELRAVMHGERRDTFPKELASCMAALRVQDSCTPAEIDAAVADAVARIQVRLAEESGSKDILAYTRLRIDLTNLRTALRVLQGTITPPFSFLFGGTLEESALETNAIASLQGAVDRSAFGYHMPHSLDFLVENPLLFEQDISHVIAGYIAPMWNKALSIEPLFAFAVTVLSQLNFLRSLFIAKRNNLPAEELREMLPRFLSGSHYVSA